MLRIKICGITRIEDAVAALECGADALGFVFHSKSPRAITPDKARAIVSELQPFINSVGVFVNKEKSEVERIADHVGLNTIQLHGSESPEDCTMCKTIIKAIRIRELIDLEPLNHYKTVSAFLLDTYSPHSIGGTGQIFNWEIAVEAKKFGKIILAGGLNPDNVEEAVRLVLPYGIDVSSGVEGREKGKKDYKKLRLFIERARKASRDYV
jgi:phosphoribosylanthranilate isomerase